MKILMVGLGSIGQRHARNLRTLLGASLELLAYRVRRSGQIITSALTIEPGADVETRYDVKVFLNLEEALDEKPDAVFIANPNSMHIPIALAAADEGCHLFIEKPLSHNFERVPELIELVEKKRLVCLVGCQLRFHPGLKLVRSLLETNAIGRVLTARLEFGEYLPGWHKYEDYRTMQASRIDLGGGVILSQIHDIDYAYSLFGLPRRVFALGGKLSTLEIEAEDTASILIEFRVEGSPVPVHIHQDFVQRPPSRTCEIVGDCGKIVWNYHGGKVYVTRADQGVPEVHNFDNFERNQLFLDEVSHFLACMAGEETPVVSVRDGANSLRIALAAKRSIETGEVVELV